MNDYEAQLEGTPILSPEELSALAAESDMLQSTVQQEQEIQGTQVSPSATAQEQVQQQPIGMVNLGGKMYPAEDIEYVTNIFGQKIPHIKREAAVKMPDAAPSYLGQNIIETGNQIRERLSSIGTGFVADFVVDALNMIPGVNLPKVPKFEDDVAQSIREISSIVLPTVTLGGAGTAAIGKATKGSKFLNDPLVKAIGNTAFSAGTGAFVDYTVEINQEDDNLAGTLKKTWPRFWGWIPNNIATLDGESADVKRAKNVLEGTYLGAGSDLLLGLSRLAFGRNAVKAGTRAVPETEKAKYYFKDSLTIDTRTPEEVVESSAAARSASLDEVGGYNASIARDPDESIFGYHDMYGYQEQGVRSVDDLGIVGASIDAARIQNDIDTIYGRIGNSVSEGALKFSLDNVDNQQMVIKGLTKELSAADDYGYKSYSGRDLNSSDIKSAGERLAATFYQMDVDELRRNLTNYQRINTTTSVPVLSESAYKGVTDALKKYMDDYVNMDYMKAQAYVGTSFAGQISDMAQGMRLTEGTPAIERAQEQILDRMEFLMVQKRMTEYSNKRFKGMFGLFNALSRSDAESMTIAEANRIEKAIRGESDKTAAALAQIKKDSKFTVDNLRQISKEMPEMLEPLFLAYELTDGNVDTITKLNNYIRQSTGVLSKAFFDGQPEIPSIILKGFWSNVYNSTLGNFGTPIKAGASAAHLLIEKPLRTMAGGLVRGDLKTIRRGWYQYSSAFESLQNSFGYMKQVFKRSGMDPDIIEARENLGINISPQLKILNSFAEAKAAQGDYGPQVLVEFANNMNDLANHPWLRFGTRAMQALDGFTQSMVAMSEAKGRVFDELTKGGKEAFDAKKGNELYRKVYDKMFDADGVITDSAVKHTAGEIAMNLDSELTDGLSALIRRMPLLRPFLLFTKTPINELKLAASYTPTGKFVKDLIGFRRPFEEVPREEVMSLLTSRGVEVTPYNIKAKYNEIQADIIGRQALGALAVSGAVGLFLNGNITGNGLYDKQKQSLRRKADWQPRSVRLPDGNWISYDNLGPLTSWLALAVDIMDNGLDFGATGVRGGVLATDEIGEMLRRAGFVFSASITEKTALAGLEPLMDLFSGNPGSIEKFAASFLSSATIRGSSQLAEISRLLDPGRKELENDVISRINNRLPGFKSTLPPEYDWIDGGEVGVPDNVFARVWNVYTPWKVNGKISPEKQFLMDIEYDARPTLSKHDGVKLTNMERSEITNIMGRDGLFKQGIQRIMSSTEGKAFRKRYKKALENGLDPDLSSFEMLHVQLDIELREAMRMAKMASPNFSEIQRRSYQKRVVGEYLRRGDEAAAERFLDYMKNFSY